MDFIYFYFTFKVEISGPCNLLQNKTKFTKYQPAIHFSWLLFFQISTMPSNDIPGSLIYLTMFVPTC